MGASGLDTLLINVHIVPMDLAVATAALEAIITTRYIDAVSNTVAAAFPIPVKTDRILSIYRNSLTRLILFLVR